MYVSLVQPSILLYQTACTGIYIPPLVFFQRSGALLVNNRLPSLVNLSEDAQLSEVLLYVLKVGVTTVGRSGGEKGEEPHDIELAGTLILKDHW